MIRFIALLVLAFASTEPSAAGLTAGGLTEFEVELTPTLRELAGRGQLSPVAHALVTIAVPGNFSPSDDWPVLVVSATSDPKFNSSRQLLGVYAMASLASGWILVAA